MRSRTAVGKWGDYRIVDFDEADDVYSLLVLPDDELEHSIPPIEVTLEFPSGGQTQYKISGPCKECGRP